jgi:hypothetical protein
MARQIRLVSWLAAAMLALMVCALAANRPQSAVLRADVQATPPAIVTSPRLGHYDPGHGHYVWWR